ncbi:MAG: peptidoglycan-binding protein [Polyangiaceae bacterium]|nr:peptidoglycan-binding protein [Polyangiaceae bacterium]
MKLPKATVRIAFIVQGSWKYELSVGKETFSGSVPSGSPIEHPIDPAATDATLLVWPDKGDDVKREGLLTYPIQLGYLDPVEEVSGIQGMLTNLGYYWGSINGVLSDDTKVAIQAFQRANGITASGSVDDALKTKLKEKHDG